MTQVIINDILPKTQIIATGGQTVFSTNWTADSSNDVVVYQRAANTEANDATQKLATNLYTVSFIGISQTVQVTLINPATLGDIVTITRVTPVDRENLYSNTNFTPTMLNQDFGLFTLMIQENDLYNQQITPRYNLSALINTWDLILPQLGPGESWVMNSDGNQILSQVAGGGASDVLSILAGHGINEGASLIGLNPSGTVQDLANAQFILKQASSTAPNAQALGSLTTGLLKNTTVTGLLSIAIPGTDYYAPGSGVIPIVQGGTGATTAAAARSNLGLTIGTNVEAWSAALDSIAGLVTSADQMIYTTAANTYTTSTISSAGRTLVAQTTTANMVSYLGALPLTGGTMSGVINMGSHQITNVTDPTNAQDAATKAYADNIGANYLPLVGGTMSGIINMGNHKITNLTDPTNAQDAATRNYVDGALNNYLPLSGGTMTGSVNMNSFGITGLPTPTNSGDAANKGYVDSIAAGLVVQQACYAATTANLTSTYANGASGIGATLTNSGALAQFTVDGTTPATNARILVKNQSTTLQNGIYTLTNQGSGVVAWVLTRATDYDQPSEIQPGDLVIINNGTVNGGASFVETDTVTAIGTDPIQFSQFTFSATSVLLKANNLSDVASATTSFNNISPLTTKGDLIGYSTTNTRLAVGASNGQILQVDSTSAVGFSWSTASYPATTTANQLLYSSATNTVTGLATLAGGVLVTDASSVPQFLTNPSATGKMLQSANGAIPTWSTSTYPSGSVTAGKVIISDGTNFIASTPTFPNTSPGAGNILIGNGTNWVVSTPTYPNSSVTAGKVLISDGTNFVASTPTYPNSSAIAGKIIISDGTNFIASTPTYPNTSATAGKLLVSDGTNFVASTPTYPNASETLGKIIISDGTNFIASTPTYPNAYTANNILYASAANTIAGLATANNGVLVTNGSGVPSISTTLPSGIAATNMNLTTPAIGTPSSGTLTNCTSLPISTGVSGLGTGVATLLGETTTFGGAPTTWTPGFTGFSANPTVTATYYLIGKMCFINVLSNTNGTSNSVNFTMTGLPFTSATGFNTIPVPCLATDNGAQTSCIATIPTSSTTVTFTKGFASGGGNWTASGNKSVNLQFWYPIA